VKRYFLLFILTLFIFDAFPQKKVSGIVTEIDGTGLQGTYIHEDGTTNQTVADANGKFQITTLKDTSLLSFSFIGFLTASIRITQDTTFNIVLEESCRGCCGCPGWLSIGVKYDIANSMLGLDFSNGYNEMWFIHFEEFPDNLIYKINAQTNFYKDYSFGANLRWKNFQIGRWAPSIGYEQYDYSSKDFFHRDIYVAASTYKRRIRTSFILQTGFQTLNGTNNWGACMGLQKWLTYDRLYSGISVGYYFDYLIFSIYFQGLLKEKVSYRLSYNRIDNYNFFNIGLNLLFNRLKK